MTAGGRTTRTKSTQKIDESVSRPETIVKPKRDWGWLLIIVCIILLIVGASFVNHFTADKSIQKIQGTIDIDNGDADINWERYPTSDINLAKSLVITESGTYRLTGSLEDGTIAIKADHDSSKIRLILDGVTIANSTGPAIACYSADDLVIELVGENYFEDASVYSGSFDEDVTGVIYSKDDLTFQGDGSLTIVANYADGIVGKDDLKFNSGTYHISAKDDGIRGKDSVYIINGTYTIESTADAIKSTNDTKAGKGFVLIEDGVFDLTASAKGIKATNSILIEDGDFKLSTYDDSIHSNNYVGIANGLFSISSGDDGIHADKELIIDGGVIEIAKSYEGLEAKAVTINNGEISILSFNDGINAGGGVDSSANNRKGADAFDADTDCLLTINGGILNINASGDGLDSNGYLYINGGTISIDGPINNGNGALDSGAGIIMAGGEVIAVGSSGMAESLGSNSSIHNISVFLSESQSAQTHIEIKDASEKVILEHTSKKSFSHFSAGTDDFELGETYTIFLNGEEYKSFTVSEIVTVLGNDNSIQNTFPNGPMDSQRQTR